MIKINSILRPKKILSRYDEKTISLSIANLARQDKQGRLIFNIFEKPREVYFENIRKPLELMIGFRLSSIHFQTIKDSFQKYNVKVLFPKKQNKRQKWNESIIREDININHYSGRGDRI